MADSENVTRIQTNFTSGEFDPLLRGRIDLEQYQTAADTLTNVTVLPQGVVQRRAGLQYIGTIPSAAAPQNGVRLVNFEFSTTQQYVFLFSNTRLYIYKLGVLQTNINGSGNDYLDLSSTGIASATLAELYFSQSADTLIVTQEDIAPVSITRGANHTTWTVANITFKYTPKTALTISTSNPAGTLTPSATEGNITLTSSSSVWVTGSVNQYVNAENGFGRAKIIKYNSAAEVEAHVEIPFSDTSAIANGDWEYESGYADIWSGSNGYPRTSTFHEGRLYFGGSLKKPTTVWGSVVGDYYNFNAGQQLADEAIEATLDTDTVNAITGIASNRDLIVFTTGGEFFVPQGSLDPIEPTNVVFKATTRSGSLGIKPISTENATYFIQRQGKQLREYIFTDTDVNYRANNFSLFSSHLINSPVDMTFRKQTNTSSSDMIIIVNGDGAIASYPFLRAQQVVSPSRWTTAGSFLSACVDFNEIYTVVSRPANNFASCTITVTDYSNIATGATITLTNAAGTEVTFTCQGASASPSPDTNKFFHNESNNTTADNIFTCINLHDDFTVANPAANVITIVRAASGYENLTVTTSDPTRLAVTQFSLGSESVYYLEKFDEDFTTDSGKQYSSSLGNAITNTTATSLNHIDGYNVDVIRDDLSLSKRTVSSNQTSLDAIPSTYVEVGIPYDITIKTMPIETKLPTGNVQGFIKKVTEVNLILYRTQSINVDGEDVSFRNLETLKLGSGIEFFSGIKTIQPVSGFSDETQITIKQSHPLFFYLLAIEYKVSV
jgi:hypothetical protein